MTISRTPRNRLFRNLSATVLATSIALGATRTAAFADDLNADSTSGSSDGSAAGSSSNNNAAGSAGSSGLPGSASGKLNDPTCKPAPEHPRPVVLLHGTGSNISDFKGMTKTLLEDGYCVWGETYGTGGPSIQGIIPMIGGNADINESAHREAGFIDNVLAATGAEKVDLVGHSQGGLLTKLIIEKEGKADKVERVVTMGAPFHGTDFNGLGAGLRGWITATPKFAEWILATASTQQIRGSKFLEETNKLPDTHAGITYTSMYSPWDTTVTPHSTSWLEEVPGADVANIDTAVACGQKGKVLHPMMPSNKTFVALAKWGLERPAGEKIPAPGAHCE